MALKILLERLFLQRGRAYGATAEGLDQVCLDKAG